MVVKLLLTIGSYEKTIHGVDFKLQNDGKTLISKKVSFSMPAHSGYVTAISSGSNFLVSGSTDETIRIFDLKRRKDFGSLTCHSGSVSSLAFYKQRMLFSGGEDGKIMVTRCSDWEQVMTLRGHSKGVSTIAIHPSGKLALSSGRDRAIKTWNLVTGKIALKTKSDYLVDRILWSPQGTSYAYISERHVQVFVTDGAKNILDYAPQKKILCSVFLSESQLAIAGEGSDISIYDSSTQTWSSVNTEHRPRIKDLQRIDTHGHVFVASGSSDGLVCIWRFDNGRLELVATEKSNLRITCLTITDY